MPAIEVERLRKVFSAGGVTALDDVSFTIDYGEVFAYLGRNGSGKTTTVRALTGLTRPTSGAVHVGGVDVIVDPRGVRRLIGVTLQSTALDQEMTCREHLAMLAGFWGASRRTAREQADELLEDFGLFAARDRLVGALSGGMRRRLDLAGALLHGPRILFLDEPTTGLDSQSRRSLWNRIAALRASGTAVFLTTQYLEEAEVLATRVAIIDAGRVVATGTPDDLKRELGVAQLRAQISDAEHVLHGGLALGPVQTGGWFAWPTTCAAEALEQLELLRSSGVEVMQFSLAAPSLEDVFLSVTGTSVDEPTPHVTELALEERHA
jgi:ABC-2 type transport system ATP-binding protein